MKVQSWRPYLAGALLGVNPWIVIVLLIGVFALFEKNKI